MSHLLDANALVALCWPPHEHHQRMGAWFARHATSGWATCALTQAAFVRLLCQPVIAGRPMAMGDVAQLLLRNTAHPSHRYLAAAPELATVLATCTGGLMGHRQVADAWLLATAVQHGMKLLSFDRGVPMLLATEAERQRHIENPARLTQKKNFPRRPIRRTTGESGLDCVSPVLFNRLSRCTSTSSTAATP